MLFEGKMLLGAVPSQYIIAQHCDRLLELGSVRCHAMMVDIEWTLWHTPGTQPGPSAASVFHPPVLPAMC